MSHLMPKVESFFVECTKLKNSKCIIQQGLVKQPVNSSTIFWKSVNFCFITNVMNNASGLRTESTVVDPDPNSFAVFCRIQIRPLVFTENGHHIYIYRSFVKV